MNRCPSCGGIINRDCFNSVECAYITNSLNSQENVTMVLRIEKLEALLRQHNIPIPDEEVETKPYIDNYDPSDNLPF